LGLDGGGAGGVEGVGEGVGGDLGFVFVGAFTGGGVGDEHEGEDGEEEVTKVGHGRHTR
jgi:hypothetical protein